MNVNELNVSKTALLFFDMLNVYYHGAPEETKKRMKPVVDNAVRLMNVARQNGMLICYAMANHRSDGESRSLVVTDTSRALARAVLYPPHWHVAWPAARAMQLLAIGSLPPSIRQAYGFEWRTRDVRAFARWTALLRASLRLLPPAAREWPMARRRSSSRFQDLVEAPGSAAARRASSR